MPLLKSPGQILKVWKRATTEYLKLNELEKLPSKENEWAVKFVKGLERLRKMAQQIGELKKIPVDSFVEAREQGMTPLEKLRKLFKPRKSQPRVRKYHSTMCQLFLVLEKLRLEELDDSESDPSATALDDVNGDSVDARDGPGDDAPEPQDAAPATPAPAAAPPPPPPAPATPLPRPQATSPPPPQPPLPSPDPEALRYAERLRKITAAVQADPGDSPRAADLQRLLAAAQAGGTRKDYGQAHARFDEIEALLRQPSRARAAPETPEKAFTKRWEELLPAVKHAQERAPAFAPRLATLLKATEALSAKGNMVGANALLDQLRQAQEEAERAAPSEAAQFQDEMKKLLPRVLAVHKTNHPAANAIKALTRDAYAKGRGRDFREAQALLEAAQELLALGATPAEDAPPPPPPPANSSKNDVAPEPQQTPRARGGFVAMQQARVLWDNTRQRVEGQLKALQKAIKDQCQALNKDPNADYEIDLSDLHGKLEKVNGIMEKFDTRLIDKLDQGLAAREKPELAQQKHQEAVAIIQEYQTFLANDEILALIDNNGFLATSIKPAFAGALDELTATL